MKLEQTNAQIDLLTKLYRNSVGEEATILWDIIKEKLEVKGKLESELYDN